MVDGADNFAARYLLNDACVKLASRCVRRRATLEGRGQPDAGAIAARRRYRCLFPEPPLPEAAPNRSEVGVLGVLPGATDCCRRPRRLLLLGLGDPLVGRILHFDALHALRTRLQPDPDCLVCAPGKPFPGYIEYAAFCAG